MVNCEDCQQEMNTASSCTADVLIMRGERHERERVRHDRSVTTVAAEQRSQTDLSGHGALARRRPTVQPRRCVVRLTV